LESYLKFDWRVVIEAATRWYAYAVSDAKAERFPTALSFVTRFGRYFPAEREDRERPGRQRGSRAG